MREIDHRLSADVKNNAMAKSPPTVPALDSDQTARGTRCVEHRIDRSLPPGVQPVLVGFATEKLKNRKEKSKNRERKSINQERKSENHKIESK